MSERVYLRILAIPVGAPLVGALTHRMPEEAVYRKPSFSKVP